MRSAALIADPAARLRLGQAARARVLERFAHGARHRPPGRAPARRARPDRRARARGMSLAFYAPLKSPDHPTPSGDRRMARALIEALGRDRPAGRARLPAAQLRSRLAIACASNACRRWASGARQSSCVATAHGHARPQAWLTYHGYHKAPDWLGPQVSARAGHSLSDGRGLVRAQAGGRALGARAIAPPSGRSARRTW